MKEKLKNIFLRYYKSILIGFFLFGGYSIYSFFVQLKLNNQILTLEHSNYQISSQLQRLKTINEIQNSYLQTKLLPFDLMSHSGKRYNTELVQKSNFSIIMFILGECGTCFENEIPLWNELFVKLNSKNIFMLAINISLNKDTFRKYLIDKALYFPLIQDQGTFMNYIKNYQDAEIITFIVKPDLRINEIHISFYQDPEYSKIFINKFVQKLSVSLK